MVNLSDTLSRTFYVLADPTRRALLERLHGAASLSVSELAAPFDMSLPAVMKHLDVLSDAGMVARSKEGRTVSYTLNRSSLRAAHDWLELHYQFWDDSLDRLEARVQARMAEPRSPKRKSPR